MDVLAGIIRIFSKVWHFWNSLCFLITERPIGIDIDSTHVEPWKYLNRVKQALSKLDKQLLSTVRLTSIDHLVSENLSFSETRPYMEDIQGQIMAIGSRMSLHNWSSIGQYTPFLFATIQAVSLPSTPRTKNQHLKLKGVKKVKTRAAMVARTQARRRAKWDDSPKVIDAKRRSSVGGDWISVTHMAITYCLCNDCLRIHSALSQHRSH